jgi:hypothetical protein
MRTFFAALRACGVVLLLAATGCTQAPASLSPATPTPAGEARLWFYRGGSPFDSPESRIVRLNGAPVGVTELSRVFYRDAPPGRYRISVDSVELDHAQLREIDLAAGQQAFVKITTLRNAIFDGDDLFFIWLVPAETARAEMAGLVFAGGAQAPVPVAAR